jgi:hypothetical protein
MVIERGQRQRRAAAQQQAQQVIGRAAEEIIALRVLG